MDIYQNLSFVDVGVFDYIRNFYWVMMSGNAEAFINYAEHGFYNGGYFELLKAKADILKSGKQPDEIQGFLEEHKGVYNNIFTGESLEWDQANSEIFFTGPNQDNFEEERKIQLNI